MCSLRLYHRLLSLQSQDKQKTSIRSNLGICRSTIDSQRRVLDESDTSLTGEANGLQKLSNRWPLPQTFGRMYVRLNQLFQSLFSVHHKVDKRNERSGAKLPFFSIHDYNLRDRLLWVGFAQIFSFNNALGSVVLRNPTKHRSDTIRNCHRSYQKYRDNQPDVLYFHRNRVLHQSVPLQLTSQSHLPRWSRSDFLRNIPDNQHKGGTPKVITLRKAILFYQYWFQYPQRCQFDRSCHSNNVSALFIL